MSRQQDTADTHPPAIVPWWRLPIVWMVLGGPAIVVVAAIGTAVIAYRSPEVILDTTPPAASGAPGDGGSLEPAMSARNHAASPR